MMLLVQLCVVLITMLIVSCDAQHDSSASSTCPAVLACLDLAMIQPIDPIPNIEASMGGFNPILSNPNQEPDPGFRGQIFKPYIHLEDGRVMLSSFITKSWANQQCTRNFVTKIITNYNQYRQEKMSSYSFGVGAGISASTDVWLAHLKSSFGFGLELDDEEQKIRKLFKNTNGELIISTSICRTHTIEVASYLTPTFTRSFEEGLRSLYYAAMNPNPTDSKNAYIRFTNIFGTHYLKKTNLGAKLIFEKRLTRKSQNGVEEERRKNCVRVSAAASVGGSIVLVGSAEDSFSRKLKNCIDTTNESSYLTENGIQSEKVTSIGSLPSKYPEAWAKNIVNSVPISFELEPLSTLFENLDFFFDPLDSSDFDKVYFNGSAVSTYFQEASAQYCSLVLGRDCTTATTGCGLNSFCSTEEDCVNDPTIPLGHRCDRSYGGVVIAGGWDGKRRVLSTEAFATHQRPSLPEIVSGLSLTRVRDTLYSCGGKIDTGEFTDKCYTIDLLSSAPVWSETVRLPVVMSWHTAVTVGDNIWFGFESQLHSLDTQTDTFRTFSLPFTITNKHCAVASATHSYIIGVGSEHSEVWVNKEASSPAEWQRVSTLLRHGEHLACLWPQANTIVITGGGGTDGNVYTSLLDTTSNTITPAADMLHARTFHKMMVLDGKPAVVGGQHTDSTGKVHIHNSIDTYNTATDHWQRHTITTDTKRSAFGLAQLAG